MRATQSLEFYVTIIFMSIICRVPLLKYNTGLVRASSFSLGMSPLCLKIRGWHAHCTEPRGRSQCWKIKALSLVHDIVPSLNKLWWLGPYGECHSTGKSNTPSRGGLVEVVDVLHLELNSGDLLIAHPATQWRWDEAFCNKRLWACPWCPSVRHSDRSNAPGSF